jgi:hypothetical protein
MHSFAFDDYLTFLFSISFPVRRHLRELKARHKAHYIKLLTWHELEETWMQ